MHLRGDRQLGDGMPEHVGPGLPQPQLGGSEKVGSQLLRREGPVGPTSQCENLPLQSRSIGRSGVDLGAFKGLDTYTLCSGDAFGHAGIDLTHFYSFMQSLRHRSQSWPIWTLWRPKR